MAAIRLLALFVALLGFFLVGVPLQVLMVRLRPAAAAAIPLFFCRSILRIAQVRLDVEGSWPKGEPVILAANHVSWIDILALGALTPFCFLAKSDVARWPIVSAFATVQGTVFVDRRRRRSIPGANRAMAARMIEGRPVLLFPEGTTLAGPMPGRFHSSHLAAARDFIAMAPERGAVSVQPVALAYSRADAAWVGDEALLPHLWRVLREPPLTCAIRFAPPLAYGAGSDRKLLARQAREAVAALLAKHAPAPARLAAAPADVAAAVRS